MRHILFFGLKEDLLPVLEIVDREASLKYTTTGNFRKDEFNERCRTFNAGAELPNLGKATNESSSACEKFLVCDRQMPVNLRNIHGFDGERVCVDQLLNPDTVTFTSGGIWNEGVILHGRIATASDSAASQAIMRRFHAAIKKSFKKVKAFYVGPNAQVLWESGKRLTVAEQSPREIDLTPE